jgi:hypothetical protein
MLKLMATGVTGLDYVLTCIERFLVFAGIQKSAPPTLALMAHTAYLIWKLMFARS